VWVGAAPYLLFLPDRHGDDRIDGEPRILLDGFGYQDTHETLNSFIWGPDGWLYGCHGVFTHSRVGKPGTPDAARTPINAGVWRYHPTRHEFEVFAWGSSNPWGVDFNDHGHAFITACVIPHLYHVIQGARYQRQAGQDFNPHVYDDIKTIAVHRHYAGDIRDHAWWGRDQAVAHLSTDEAGGGHAHCGAMVYLGDNWPARYRNQIFMNNVHGNRVNNDSLRPRGSGYVGDRLPDLLFANDGWFRGINLKYGPDGSVYLIDWYDKNACHRNQPEIWDRTNGRVFRIRYGEHKPTAVVDLASLSDAELVALHTHRNDWQVRTARRLLQERGGNLAMHGALSRMVETAPDTPQRLRALWTLHATGGLSESYALALLGDRDEHLRAWAIQLTLEDRVASPALLERMAALAQTDPSPVVRLYLAAALQRLDVTQRWDIAAGLLQHGEDADDHNLPLLIWYGVEPLVAADPPRALAHAAATSIPLVSRFIYRRAASDPEALAALVEVLGDETAADRRAAILNEIATVVKTRGRLEMPAAWPQVYEVLARSDSADVRAQAQLITVKFGDKSVFPALRAIVADGESTLDARRQALDALLAGKDSALPPLLHKLLDDTALRVAAIRGLAQFDHEQTPHAILAHYADWPAAERSDAVQTLAARRAFAHALLDAVAANAVPREDVTAFTVRQMLSLNDAELNAKLNRTWGSIRATPEEKQQLIAEFKNRLRPETLAGADLFGDGEKIGPDITGSNRANLDYVLENLLDPSAVVGRDYQMTVIATVDGRVLSGLILQENDSAVTLQTINEAVVIPLADIDERSRSPLSLMPDGQLTQMKPDEVRDLIAYLASPRQVPLPGEGPQLDPQTGRVHGALEGESLVILEKTAGDVRPQNMSPFTKDKWSGADHLWWTGAAPGARLTLKLPVAATARYELFAVMTKARDYGIVQLAFDDEKLGAPIDLFNTPDVITTGVVSLGQRDLTAGDHRLTIEIVGANPAAVKAYMFGLDYIYLARPVATK
jgi:putative membrane-bound dehydrogenase-like protein